MIRHDRATVCGLPGTTRQGTDLRRHHKSNQKTHQDDPNPTPGKRPIQHIPRVHRHTMQRRPTGKKTPEPKKTLIKRRPSKIRISSHRNRTKMVRSTGRAIRHPRKKLTSCDRPREVKDI